MTSRPGGEWAGAHCRHNLAGREVRSRWKNGHKKPPRTLLYNTTSITKLHFIPRAKATALLPTKSSKLLPHRHTIIMSSTDTTDVQDNGYVSRTGQSTIPVQKDSAAVEDPIDPATADSDEVLGKHATSHTQFYLSSHNPSHHSLSVTSLQNPRLITYRT